MDPPEELPDNLRPIGSELARLEESARISAQSQFEQTKLWRLVNSVLGIPAAGLAAFAGGTVITSTSQMRLPGFLSLGASALTAILVTVNANQRAEKSQSTAKSYLDLQTHVRQLLLVDLRSLDYDRARTRLAELTTERSRTNNVADPPSRIAYWLARRNLRQGGQTYQPDDLRGRDGADHP